MGRFYFIIGMLCDRVFLMVFIIQWAVLVLYDFETKVMITKIEAWILGTLIEIQRIQHQEHGVIVLSVKWLRERLIPAILSYNQFIILLSVVKYRLESYSVVEF